MEMPKFKPSLIICLGIFLALSVIFNIVALTSLNKMDSQNKELSSKNQELSEDYEEMRKNYNALLDENEENVDPMLEIMTRSIDYYASIYATPDKTLNIIMHYADGIKERIEVVLPVIKDDIKDKYKNCLITVIDEEGKNKFGWNVVDTDDEYYHYSASN